jgi:hypothetical protein
MDRESEVAIRRKGIGKATYTNPTASQTLRASKFDTGRLWSEARHHVLRECDAVAVAADRARDP